VTTDLAPHGDPFLLDLAACHRVVDARDRRFDGVIFVAIQTTRIYCRPHCPSRLASHSNRRFYATQVEAERDGFRPCRRCRPELAPGRSSIEVVSRLARAAARRIAAGELNGRSVRSLADALGVCERQLRRALSREFGVSPVELAQTHRLMLAKQLLVDTRLPLTQVAYASGFQSLRRFNALMQERYRVAPKLLRKRSGSAEAGTGGKDVDIVLALNYRPPYDWRAMITYLAARATPGVEAVTLDQGGTYRRTIQLRGHTGSIAVQHVEARHSLRIVVTPSLSRVLAPLLARVRRVFDLDAEPRAVVAHLGSDPALAPYVSRRPGLRVPGAMDGFELALRAVLAPHASARAASDLTGRLVEHLSAPLPGATRSELRFLPLTAESIAEAGVDRVRALGMPKAFAGSVIALARAVRDGHFDELTAAAPTSDPREFCRRFTELPGIGAWTAEYVAMRALSWPDAFPENDVVLQKATGVDSSSRLRATSERWRPWRAYAAQHLWTGLAG
jgi:AraC family transcriptional regulator of adaptative response / DNA-3-methyladenine glycosylase II